MSITSLAPISHANTPTAAIHDLSASWSQASISMTPEYRVNKLKDLYARTLDIGKDYTISVLVNYLQETFESDFRAGALAVWGVTLQDGGTLKPPPQVPATISTDTWDSFIRKDYGIDGAMAYYRSHGGKMDFEKNAKYQILNEIKVNPKGYIAQVRQQFNDNLDSISNLNTNDLLSIRIYLSKGAQTLKKDILPILEACAKYLDNDNAYSRSKIDQFKKNAKI